MTGERISQPMSESDVANAIDAFARAASDAERLGFDGIELMGAHGYLINQFFYDHLNLRNDGYGGSTLVERSRFAVEILKAVRSVVSPGFPVILSPFAVEAKRLQCTACRDAEGAGTVAYPCSSKLVRTPSISRSQNSGSPPFPEIDAELNLAGWAKKLTGVHRNNRRRGRPVW